MAEVKKLPDSEAALKPTKLRPVIQSGHRKYSDSLDFSGWTYSCFGK